MLAELVQPTQVQHQVQLVVAAVATCIIASSLLGGWLTNGH